MKKIIFYAIALFLLFVSVGCEGNKEKKADRILNDEDLRAEIMTEISKDQDMMSEFIGHMMGSDHAMMMMSHDTIMMRKMMHKNKMIVPMMMKDSAMRDMMMGNMMKMMETDSSMCYKFTNRMMENEHMMGMMHSMDKKKGELKCPVH